MKIFEALMALGLLVAGAVPPTAALPSGGDAVAGKQTFTQRCSICHGAGAKGFIGPSIAGIDWTVPGLHAIVRFGVGGYGGMPAFNADAVTEKNIADIAAYLASLAPVSASAPRSAASPQVTAVAESAVAAVPVSSPSASSAAIPSTSSVGTPVAARAPDQAHGHEIYSANCAACHGASAQGGIGPSLHGEKTRKDAAAAIAWIKNPLPPMPKLYPAVLSEKDVKDVAAYVESL